MTYEGLGEMFEGDSADMCAKKFLFMLMVGYAEGLEFADLGARTPIGMSGNLSSFLIVNLRLYKFYIQQKLKRTDMIYSERYGHWSDFASHKVKSLMSLPHNKINILGLILVFCGLENYWKI
jgi:hypothetical protein